MTMRAACPCPESCTSPGTDSTRYGSPILHFQGAHHTASCPAPILDGVCTYGVHLTHSACCATVMQ